MIPILEIGNRCISCDNCKQICPENAIIVRQNVYSIDIWNCTICQICIEVCPIDCIKLAMQNTEEQTNL